MNARSGCLIFCFCKWGFIYSTKWNISKTAIKKKSVGSYLLKLNRFFIRKMVKILKIYRYVKQHRAIVLMCAEAHYEPRETFKD